MPVNKTNTTYQNQLPENGLAPPVPAEPSTHLTKVITAFPDPYLLLKPNLTGVVASAAFFKITGTQPHNWVDQNFLTAFSGLLVQPVPALLGNLQTLFDQALSTKTAQQVAPDSFQIRSSETANSNFTLQYWGFSVSVVLDHAGAVEYLLFKINDLTAQKKVEQQLQEQAHYLRRITQTVPDMVSVIELQTGQAQFLNKETFINHGFDPEAMRTSSARERAEIIYPDDRQVLHEYFKKLSKATEEETIMAEYRARNSLSEWMWFHVQGKVFQRNNAGEVTHVLNAIENITARKNAEQEVLRLKDAINRRATDKYLTLFNAIDEGFNIIEVIFDDNGKAHDYEILEVNPAQE
ncbi:PAS domain S-box protein [Adhaeribacter swui]|uniref:histidine kinase n=1 Tax=Adhaeribacter swui TaxID=2086471 RepID=A0A7G7GBG3_9BACT|nr:PAS domain S-box protein [Adhaeribacter swui]QNF34497.1 PAS domain S-box protein [Adhaeribacter swui]